MDFGQMNLGQPSSAQLAALQSQLQGLMNNFEQINKYRGGDQAAKAKPMDVLTVAGDDGARRFLQNMPNGTSGIVFNEGDDLYFYMLKKDANGVPAPIKRCPFTMEDLVEETDNTITKKDLDDMRNDINELKSMLSQLPRQSTYRIDQRNQKGQKPQEGMSHESVS